MSYPSSAGSVSERSSSSPANTSSKSKTSKITGACMANARSRRLVNKFAAKNDISPEPRVRKQVRKREKPKGRRRDGPPTVQRGSDFEFDTVYNAEQNLPPQMTEYEDVSVEAPNAAYSESPPPSPPPLSPPHSPINLAPPGSPPPSEISNYENSYYRRGPTTYGVHSTSAQSHPPPRVSHRRQPYAGYLAHPNPGTNITEGSHGQQFYPVPPTISGNSYFPPSLPHGSIYGAPLRYQPSGQGQGPTEINYPNHMAISTPATAEYYEMCPPGQNQSLPNRMMLMYGGGQKVLDVEAKRAMRSKQPSSLRGQTSPTPNSEPSFQFEVDVETLQKLQLHEQAKVTTSSDPVGTNDEAAEDKECLES